jgi:[ribosomal protein S18]-alanine N-acetyltransferase
VKIRPANPDDLSAILALEQDMPSAAHWLEEQYREIFQPSGPRRMMLVLDDGTALKGFLVARVVDAEWEIENVGVKTSSQRLGFGTALLREFLRLAHEEGSASIFLEVRESNVPARALYSRFGFVENNRRKAYYRDPAEDAIGYRLLLP